MAILNTIVYTHYPDLAPFFVYPQKKNLMNNNKTLRLNFYKKFRIFFKKKHSKNE